MPVLDKPTLLFSFVVLSLFMAGVTLVQARATPRRGLEQWGGALLCCAVAYGLYSQRGQATMFLSFVLANVMALLAGAAAVWAYARLVLARVYSGPLLAGTSAALLSLLAMQFGGIDTVLAAVVVSGALALDMVLIVCLLARHGVGLQRELRWLAMVAAGFMALTFLVRAFLLGLRLYATLEPLTEPVEAPLAAVLMATLAFVLSTVAFIGLAAERYRNETVDHLRRDSLTGFLTRTAFAEMQAALEYQTHGTGYAVLMVDLDHFKQINDAHGHDGGDRVLAHTARLIANNMRLSDLAVRYGGEEFCLLLRGCTTQDAEQFAQRLLKLAGEQQVRLPDGQQVGFTLSAGVAVRSVEPESITELIRRADQALYRAKRAGRNRYQMAAPPARAGA